MFFDLSKAFDSVNPDIIIHKLEVTFTFASFDKILVFIVSMFCFVKYYGLDRRSLRMSKCRGWDAVILIV